MNGDNNKQGILPISSLVIALAALGVFTFSQSPFQSPRPAVPEVHEPFEKINARLWQDPFGAVLDFYAKPAEMRADNHTDLIAIEGTQTFWLKEKNSLAVRIAERSREKDASVTVLGVMVFGAPYAGETEFRLRQRYAVLAGLGRAGFVPEDPEHIGFVRLDSKKVTRGHIMPFEWFSNPRKKNDSVLLLWLNDDIFRKSPHTGSGPLTKLERLAEALGLKDQNHSATCGLEGTVHFKLIGPAGSGCLQEMLEGLEGIGDGLSGLEIYSATATVDDSLLLENLGEPERSEGEARKEVLRRFERHGIVLKRTIATDRALAEEVVDELSLRGVDLSDKKNQIMLVAEWDTLYGRSLPLIYERVLAEKGLSRKNVLRISYLRGIDGIVPGEEEKKAGGKSETSGSSGSSGSVGGDLKSLERPIGKSQYDYLRRLAGEVGQLNQEQSRSRKGSIRAIGVLGSDFYDKYLVLQALRPRFPAVPFFTTDLDARLTHPANFQWTRNLIVASSFDLKLPGKVQEELPPFRDNYQTSVFGATLRALNVDTPTTCGSGSQQKEPCPRVFEIGRDGAIDLGTRSSPAPDWIIPIFAIPLLLAFLLYFSSGTVKTTLKTLLNHKVYRKLLMAFVAVSLLFLFFFIYVIGNPGEEPFSLTGGISIWPTEILRLLAAVLSFFFLAYSLSGLRKNNQDIEKVFGLGPSAGEKEGKGSPGEKTAPSLNVFRSLRNFTKKANFWDTTNYDWEVVGGTGELSVDDLWKEYQRREGRWFRIFRPALIVGIYIIFCFMIMKTFGYPGVPVRGVISWWSDKVITILSVLSFIMLNFFVFDVIRNCRRFIIISLLKSPKWHGHSEKSFLHSEGILVEGSLGEWMLINLIAKRTDVAGRLIFYPFIIWLLLFVSRINYFDNWDLSVGLAIVLGLGALYAWSSVFILRRSAENARSSAIERLSKRMASILSEPNPDQKLIKQVDFELKEIRAIRQGAFAPVTQHPVLQALLIPFGGVGGVYLIEFLTKLNV